MTDLIDQIKALCHSMGRGVGYRVSGDHSTWDSHTEGKSDFAGEILDLIEKAEAAPPSDDEIKAARYREALGDLTDPDDEKLAHTPTSTEVTDEREALTRRMLIIAFGYEQRHAEWHQQQRTDLWRRTLASAEKLMASPEWMSRQPRRLSDEEIERAADAYMDAGGRAPWPPALRAALVALGFAR